MEWKQGKKDEVQDRSDVKPGEHGDGERACGFSWQALIGRLSLARKLRLDRLTVEENKPPDADQKRHAVDDEDNPAERLHALGWQIGAFGVGENGIRNAMGIPMTPKKTDRPP